MTCHLPILEMSRTRLHRQLVAAGAAAILLGGTTISHSSLAATVAVTSCDDDNGSGTLRSVIAGAGTGDSIDLTKLMCSAITLESSQIPILQADLTLLGPETKTFTISGNKLSRIFVHSGTGVLTINNLTITEGKYKSDHAYGGCVFSAGSVTLNSSAVSNCSAKATDGKAAGGGIFAASSVSLVLSDVTGNSALGYASAFGGGLFAHSLTSTASSISNNHVARYQTTTYRPVHGGGAVVTNAEIQKSTLSANYSYGGGAALYLAAGTLFMINSTASGNHAAQGAAVLEAISSHINIYSSTIAFNFSDRNNGCVCAIALNTDEDSIKIENTIATNTKRGALFVLDLLITQNNTTVPLNVSGTNNVVSQFSWNATAAPGFIISTADPLLTPLSFHGGPVATHASLSTSPIIGIGSNAHGLTTDERGNGFPRENAGNTDVGAYERQPTDDEIFADGVEMREN